MAYEYDFSTAMEVRKFLRKWDAPEAFSTFNYLENLMQSCFDFPLTFRREFGKYFGPKTMCTFWSDDEGSMMHPWAEVDTASGGQIHKMLEENGYHITVAIYFPLSEEDQETLRSIGKIQWVEEEVSSKEVLVCE